MKSVMSHQFSQVPKANIQRSTFDRSHGYKTTFDAGYLIPVFVDEALPGDTHSLNITAFARLATPKLPIMDNMKMDFFFFSVPLRLVWDNFKKFMGEQTDPGDSTDYTVPIIDAGTATFEGSLQDYFGLPKTTAASTTPLEVNSLYFRAYNLIWNEWFRDENLQDSVVVDKDDGPDAIGDYTLLRRGKRHDYFTSCLPWPQKGDAVDLPLGESAPITGLGKIDQTYGRSSDTPYETDGSGTVTYADSAIISYNNGMIDEAFTVEEDPNNAGYPNIRADLSNATAATINSLRQAFQLQRMLEKDARGGTRYTELVRSHFGVVSPDARLQRPEYLGGGSVPINVTAVPQTSETNTTPQGHQAGYGIASGTGNGFNASFTEHSIIIGLASVRADLTYQYGLEKKWTRSTRYDYFWPSLAQLGEQVVENKEIFFQGSQLPSVNDGTFGYQERYAEYRYFPSKITGLFRSNATASLDAWHLSEEITSTPYLNSDFIESDPPIDRVIVTPTEPHFLYDSYIKLRSVRPMPVYGIPGMIDHF